MGLIRFWRSLTKKDSVKSARYEIGITFSSTSTSVLVGFFHGSRFLVDPAGKKNPDPKH